MIFVVKLIKAGDRGPELKEMIPAEAQPPKYPSTRKAGELPLQISDVVFRQDFRSPVESSQTLEVDWVLGISPGAARRLWAYCHLRKSVHPPYVIANPAYLENR
jgi:hypothetical protein